MSDISVRLDEQEELDFDISINVASNNIDEQRDVKVRFIVEDSGINYTFNARKKEEGGYSVRIPVMEQKMHSGDKNCSLEVICNNRYFPAWQGVVNFEKSVKVEAAIIKVNRNNEPEIKVESITKNEEQPMVDIVKKEEIVQEIQVEEGKKNKKHSDSTKNLNIEKPKKVRPKIDRNTEIQPPKQFRETVKDRKDRKIKEAYNKILANRKNGGLKFMKNEQIINLRRKKLISSLRDL